MLALCLAILRAAADLQCPAGGSLARPSPLFTLFVGVLRARVTDKGDGRWQHQGTASDLVGPCGLPEGPLRLRDDAA